MGYFSNGTEVEMFQSLWCNRCAHDHFGSDTGCPVMNAHWLYAYELCNDKEHPGKVILDMLIPETPDGFNDKCAMFKEKP